MYFLVFARDRPGQLALRMSVKTAHVAHLDGGDSMLRVLQSGPWTDASAKQAGSLLIVQADSQEAVEAFMARDPYMQAELFESVEIRPWVWRRGNPYLSES